MCGIWGFIGSKPADLTKMKVLGIYNQSRGKHSCGYWCDGVLRHGVDKAKEWTDFITDGMTINKEGSEGGKVFLGHTRSATVGTHVLGNAHPFKVENYVQVHNGTLDNAFALCDKYEINHKDIHVDSLALATLIKKKGWSILDEYVGFAALLMCFEDEPDVMYAYHGSSRKEKDKDLVEERPMFIMEGNDCYYFSSLDDSLMAIRDTIQQEPKILTHNRVYKFQVGKQPECVYEVNRADNNLEFLAPKKSVVVQGFWPGGGSNYKQKNLFKDIQTTTTASMVLKEKPPKEAANNKNIYFWKGRYWKSIGNNNFAILVDGIYHISKGGEMRMIGDKQAEAYYFINGVLLPNGKTYKKLRELEKVDKTNLSTTGRTKHNYAFYISKFSKYPVTCLEEEGVIETPQQFRCLWFHAERIFSGVLTPKFSSRQYVISEGRLTKVYRDEGDYVFTVPSNPTNIKGPIIVDENGVAIPETFNNNLKVVKAQPVNDAEPISEEVKWLMTYFDINFINIEETSDLPDAVYGAIENYIDDYLESRLSTETFKQMSVKDKDEYYQEFVINTVRDRNSFLGYMDVEFRKNLQYYIEVAIHDLEKAEQEVGKIKDVPNKEDTENYFGKQDDDNLAALAADAMSISDVAFNEIHETEQAKQQFDDLVDQLIDMNKLGDKFQKLANSDLAQDNAWIIYKVIDFAKETIKDVIKDPELIIKLKTIDCPF